MFDPKRIFPIVKKSFPNSSDQQVLGALTKLAQAHPNLSEEQALAALQQALPSLQKKRTGVGSYLTGGR